MSINIENKVQTLIEGIVKNIGYNIYDIQFVKEGKDYYLRIFIEKDNGEITLEDCEIVNNAITDKLDEADFIKEQYFLEVSSTGIEKVLRKKEHYLKQIGNEIEVKLYKAIEKNKVYIGILKDINDDSLVITVDNEDITINLNNISISKTVYKW